jgi:competence protein ComFC
LKRINSYLFYHGLWTALDWLFPPQCGGCGELHSRWCAKCQNVTLLIKPPICERCGIPINHVGICQDCKENEPHFTAVRSWAIYEGPLKEALQRLKYQRDIGLGEVFAKPLINLIADNQWAIDMVVPVPLGIARYKERGYNQSTLIAFPIALYFGYSFRPSAIRRTRETQSQVGLNLTERRRNVVGAFSARSNIVEGKNVLIIDDIATSGSTMEACASALKIAGAYEVYGLTVARAVLNQPQSV